MSKPVSGFKYFEETLLLQLDFKIRILISGQILMFNWRDGCFEEVWRRIWPQALGFPLTSSTVVIFFVYCEFSLSNGPHSNWPACRRSTTKWISDSFSNNLKTVATVIYFWQEGYLQVLCFFWFEELGFFAIMMFRIFLMELCWHVAFIYFVPLYTSGSIYFYESLYCWFWCLLTL